ncbi:MAG: hypothetical protein J6R44_03070, partial [Clostridia bacterium]|nr:hypothetical protein [Clostridia bacterium]
MFIRTFKLSTSAYNTLISNNNINVLVYGSASRGSTATNGGDTDMWLYLGIGTAESDEEAMSYEGFKETSCIISQKTHQAGNSSGSTYANATLTNINARYPITSGLKNTATQKITEVPGSGTKYLRIAMFAEVWAEKAAQQLVDTIYMQLSFITSSDPYGGTMTVPDNATSNVTTTSPQGWGGTLNGVSNDTFLQNSIDTISASGTKTVGMAGDYTCVSDSGNNNGGFTSNGNYIAFGREIGGYKHLGYMYTYKLTEEMYTALISGKLKATLSCTSKGGTSNVLYGAAVQQWLYVGIGYASSDSSAMSYAGFVQMHGAIGVQGVQSDRANNYGDISLDSDGEYIKGFDFSQDNIDSSNNVSRMNKDMVSSGHTKYLRIGVWAQAYGYSSATVWYEQVVMTLQLTPTSSDTSAPTISGITNGYADSDTIVISDATGIDYYTLNGIQVDVADYRNTFNPTQVGITLSAHGQYTLEAKDLFNSTTTSVTFTYFYANIIATAETDGVANNYSGGKIVFNANYNSGNGYQSQQVTNSGDHTTTFNIWAKPNDGYYFAGFTFGDQYENLNLDINGGMYKNVKTESREFMFSWDVLSNLVSIPEDGKIYITACFKSVPLSDQTNSYNGFEQSATIVDGVENVVGTGSTNMSVYVASYNGSAELPINAGTYATLAEVKWNEYVVGVATKNFVIIPKNITASYTKTASNVTYFGGTDVTDLVDYAFGAYDIYSDDDVVVNLTANLSSKDVGARTINVNATLGGADAGNYNLTNPTDSALSITVDKLDVNVVFVAHTRGYRQGDRSADVTIKDG